MSDFDSTPMDAFSFIFIIDLYISGEFNSWLVAQKYVNICDRQQTRNIHKCDPDHKWVILQKCKYQI